MEIDNYMTPAEAAFRWGIPERTLREKFIISRREHLIKEEINQGLIKYFVKPEGKRGEWIVSVKAMERWYGSEPKKSKEEKIMLSTDQIVEKYLKMALSNPDVSFDYNDTTFVNLKRLYDFVKDNSKDSFVFEEVIKEVIEKAHVQGGPSVFYELGAYETKSGHAESISFKYESEYDEEEDTVHDTLTF